jgi:hypothetical protein
LRPVRRQASLPSGSSPGLGLHWLAQTAAVVDP